MAIPQGRMSTNFALTNGEYLPPEGVPKHPLTKIEPGPLDVGDTSKGLLYQDWELTWEPDTQNFVIKALTTLQSYIIGNSTLATHASFTFDQAGRVTFAWTNSVSSYLYWYDSQAAQTVTDDIGADILTPTIYLDDKRYTQNTVNDMLLWYTKYLGGERYGLYMKRQRDRFLIETEMLVDLEQYYIIAVGMTYGLRLQLTLRSGGYA